MFMGIDIDVAVMYALGLVLLYLAGWLLLVPLKWLIRLLWSGLLGGVLLWGLNLAGGLIGVTVAINPITALTAGFLGIPGVVMLLVLQAVL